ncbi:SDR family NAD(P)-dependent oxidoreductase [Acinetobacter pittii]|uniref:SDR family NAD(P)-dependent oxidoreductase n=1 Tax=Acinetobacter pittii TaxID=48296 RepID=UPI0023422EE1|nr:SDR family oxidoreductase [Acinetobacter pittii]MDC4554037.1 SDR family oxidoreductase [Acinetobacter baumannii]
MTTRKVALVTGSASGIGATVAITLAKAGYDLIINYSRNIQSAKSTVQACQAAGATTTLIKCDVSSEDDVIEFISQIKQKYDHLDVVCSNAGVSIDTPPKKFHEIDVNDWDRVFAVNVRGLFLIAKHTRELLLAAEKPCMVNTASIVGLRPGAQPLPYSASKSAVISMTQTLANALGPKVRVNAIAPGWMEGDWMKWMLADNYDKLMARRARATPLQRCVTAEDVAEVVLTLIEHMHFVTGETIVIDGGFAKTT